jgi:hypothetical protein
MGFHRIAKITVRHCIMYRDEHVEEVRSPTTLEPGGLNVGVCRRHSSPWGRVRSSVAGYLRLMMQVPLDLAKNDLRDHIDQATSTVGHDSPERADDSTR